MTAMSKAIVPLAGFQKAWIGDKSRFKIAAKARRVGFTFATTLEIALDAIERRTRWLIVSRTQDTAKEAVREISNHFKAMQKFSEASAAIQDQETELFFEGVRIHKFVIELPNGSEITALTAHPDAARGFGGNVFLDEHGFHRDSKELWKGAAAAVLRGHRLIVVSTPHYQTGNYYDLARKADLVSGQPPLAGARGSDGASIWSAHWVDIHRAAPELAAIGVPIDLAELRELAGDEETWAQEFCCQFLSAAEMWIPLELIAGARSPEAVTTWDPARSFEGPLYIGIDVGRKHDLTAIWIDERRAVANGSQAILRGLVTLNRMPIPDQFDVIAPIIEHPRVMRACIDAGGLGTGLYDMLYKKFGMKVEGITFTNEIKERMAILVRRRMEEKLDKIPENAPQIERAFAAIKRETTQSGNLRFDAARSDAGHADEFWAKALADLAADSGVAAAEAGTQPQERSSGFDIDPSRDREGAEADRMPSVWDADREEVGVGLFQ
jgi:phage FluMu gp28-like protein